MPPKPDNLGQYRAGMRDSGFDFGGSGSGGGGGTMGFRKGFIGHMFGLPKVKPPLRSTKDRPRMKYKKPGTGRVRPSTRRKLEIPESRYEGAVRSGDRAAANYPLRWEDQSFMGEMREAMNEAGNAAYRLNINRYLKAQSSSYLHYLKNIRSHGVE